jgi:phosphoribosylformimino-5-aminoimidazole carboxamide ribotide isomerase
MDIIPALGLKGGRWVALTAKPGEDHKPYPDGPVVKAGEFEKLGTKWIHMVDLDGVKIGRPRQLGLMRSVISRVKCKVQLGGGFRTEVFLLDALRSGASRVVLGTRAISEPIWLDDVLAAHGNEQILVSIDCILGMVAIEGWETRTSLSASVIGERLRKQGIERIVYTDIVIDDAHTAGPNLAAVEEMAEKSGLRLIVSGGIRRLEHVEALKTRLGDRLDGVIVDRGIAEGTFDLAAAVKRFQR